MHVETFAAAILKMGFLAIIRDGVCFVSAEEGDGAADYYGEFTGGYPWIHPDLEKFAEVNGLYWEWENPGCIGAYRS